MTRSRQTKDPLDIVWRDMPPNFNSFVGMIRRQASVVLLCIVVGIVLTLTAIVFARPMYTANVSLYLDADAAADVARSDVATAIDLDTHAELIRSENTTVAVIGSLNLTEVPEFAAERSTIRSAILSMRNALGLNTEVAGKVDPLLPVIQKVRAGLTVARNGNTRVLNLAFTSRSPELSVKVANAFAQAYIDNISFRDAGAVARRIDRLNLKAKDIRLKREAADARIRAILQETGLFTSDPLVMEDRISALRQQLSLLDAKTAALSTKLALYTDYERTGNVSSVAIDTPEIRRLLVELSAAKKKFLDDPQLAENNPEDASATNILIEGLEAGLRQEIGFEARSIEVERAMAKAEHGSISSQIDRLGGYMASSSWAELADVRQKKIFYDSQYQDYLGLLEGAGRERQNRADLRIISDALQPTAPSSPNIKVWLAIAVTLAALIGIGFASMREWNRHEQEKA